MIVTVATVAIMTAAVAVIVTDLRFRPVTVCPSTISQLAALGSAGEVTYADAHKKEPNTAIVCFSSHSDLKRALEKFQGKDINGRRIKLTDESDAANVEASSGSYGRIFFHKAKSKLQQGPTCGFVALFLAASAGGIVIEEDDEVDVSDMMAWARMLKFTKGGEMFSAEWLMRIGNEFYKKGSFETIGFPSGFDIVEKINDGKVFLVPYDCDKNFDPINRNGEGAHWAAVVGYFVIGGKSEESTNKISFEKVGSEVREEDLYVVAYQGKSKHPTLWKYLDLKGSNNQLNVPDRKRNEFFQLPEKESPEDVELFGLKGKAIISAAFNITGIVLAAQEEAHNVKEHRSGDKVNLPTNDITWMHEAIPFLPFPVALLCLFLNIFIPGSGTILSGFCALCMGQPRINWKEARKLGTMGLNLVVGVSQFFTITFLFVGWFWSIAWGGLIIIHAMQYREALQQRRQEAVATAAIEALTKDSILHRRDVKNLVKKKKESEKK
ncbi:hypothetical protein FO519_008917 [Halicephalobus sp. NKZ332]|nr:hypothetical protein FO519_008917 [Halicephalobus sp. NKZ332]